MQIDAQKIIDALIEQRNDAMNKLAQITAYSKQLEETLTQQKAEKNDDTNSL